MKLKELQEQIDKSLEKEKKIPLETVLNSFLKKEGFIHLKELSFVLKSRTKSKMIYQELKSKLPELTIELCSSCENVINYYREVKNDYYKCPKCNATIEEPIKTKILVNYRYLNNSKKLILIEDLKEKIKTFNLKEDIFVLLDESKTDVTNFLNSNY
jgi:predicted RNA-binding Zn-ribbon protein involved in translation (DUF1610 family)